MIKLGEGISATVYSDGKYAYKVYKEGYSLDNMKFEVGVQNEIYEHTNLNVAKYEIIDRQIKMTLFEGKNLADRITQDGYIEGFQEFVDLQCEIFKFKDLRLANSYETFAYQIKEESEMDEELKEKALASIDRINQTLHLCHFDYHPENIMYHEGKPVIIDWTNAKLGNPHMDIASTYIIFRLFVEQYADMYLQAILQKGFNINEVKDAIPVMAFIRLRETKDPVLVKQLTAFVDGSDKIFN